MSFQFGNNANMDVANINTEVTFHKEAGTSTETDIYLDIDNPIISRLHISNDKAIVVTSINGETFTDPITVSGAVGLGLHCSYDNHMESVTIRTTEATTHIECLMW